MEPQMLAPVGPTAHVIRAQNVRGPAALELCGWPERCAQQTRDRLRAAVLNSGFPLPLGATTLEMEPVLPEPQSGTDLPAALALVLADPSREHVRQPNLIAWGTLALDGSIGPAGSPPMADLPNTGWVGRFWSHPDRVPGPDEDAVLTVVDVPDLATAWKVIVKLLDIEATLRPLDGIARRS